jgi:hypothetical protein
VSRARKIDLNGVENAQDFNPSTLGDEERMDAVPMDLVPAEPPELTLELKIIKETIGIIETNAKELLVQAKEKCEEYKDLSRFIGHEDYAKKERASLNNAEKKAAEIEKDVTKKWNVPLEEFKNTMKEIRAAFKGASASLDTGIKESEQKENDKKTLEIRLYFNSKKFDLVPFETLWNPRWLLKLSKMPDIQKELDEKIEKVYKDLNVIERIAGYEAAGKAFYLNTLDINKALEEVDRLKDAAEKLAREKVDREERERQAQVQKNVDEARQEEQAAPREEQIQNLAAEALDLPEPVIRPGPKILQYVLQFEGTREELEDLKKHISNRRIAYKKVLIFPTDDDADMYMRQHCIAGIIHAAIILG